MEKTKLKFDVEVSITEVNETTEAYTVRGEIEFDPDGQVWDCDVRAEFIDYCEAGMPSEVRISFIDPHSKLDGIEAHDIGTAVLKAFYDSGNPIEPGQVHMETFEVNEEGEGTMVTTMDVKSAELEGKMVLLKKSANNADFQEYKHLIYYCSGGFGCSPRSRGTKIMGIALNDGEHRTLYREEIAEVHAMTPEYEQRLQEIKEFEEKRSNVCAKCGRDLTEVSGKKIDMLLNHYCGDYQGCDDRIKE